ncbi:DegT/DnrJ/EryC1/StrS family aminotransferase [Riemerella anatipestifer]|uniref:DegT/DnrJ/EryC1/StrS aminotransferase family protein n=1 Tax=Riemerella anatipestifer TaxID=34085 RepID=A0AAP6HFJ6_RIEAN|nr:DegT/DnrJ/EryC1/StrS aminotransferase family protein [Riemerella anatipestifer]MBT0573047.1 DegT/DnrJ/EryC1/StrS aminotransferase family protein [Riemerella anatipestifer]MCU7573699.1 DegT/DnrJ/EryC1/StrS aminotransferase family protein [Riemerella anatipestifer]MCU7594859.1 DegT/DnrJ/EryC1/StrS aminotransferase family protein [Riemerella anatipestifer]MCW0486128.1 DegT/DnrJ/EryC1/StrS aminotransferase family protein [Riemerella anatipestifer]MCW0489190.1 DegT/DnrJ/EryC1/StrS aminotransfera
MIPIFKPYMPQNIEQETMRILNSGQLAYGKYGVIFEQKLSQYIENDYMLTTITYNHSLLLVLSLLNLKQGDEVIACPVSCLASNQPFVVRGIKVIWADVDPYSGMLDLESVRKQITAKTKAIFNNLYCGYAGNLDEVYQLGKEYGVYVVDDCIEAFGTVYKGKKVGNTGADITVFSFQSVRLPNTIDGGAIAFKDKELYNKAYLIRDYGIERSKFRLSNGEINPGCDISIEGYGATMSELNSFIGIKQMENLPLLLKKQKQNALYWKEYFQENRKVDNLEIYEGCEPNYWVYGVLAKEKKKFIDEMRSKGYYASGVHINNNIYSIFNNNGELKGVDEFMSKFVALPCGWWFSNR